MSLLDLKVFREIKNQKFRSLIIMGSVAITLALIVGMRGGYPMLMASYRENLVQSNVADGRFLFTAPIEESTISAIQQDESFLEKNNIDKIEGRVIIKTDLSYKGKMFPVILIGINYPNEINQLVIEQKANNIDEESSLLDNSTNCMLESKFAGGLLGQNVQLNEKLKINIGNDEFNFTVKAFAQDIDFLYVVDPDSQMTLMGQMAVVWIDLGVLQDELFQGEPLINQVLFTVNDRLNKGETNQASDGLIDYFDDRGVAISTLKFTLFDETIDRKFFDSDAGAMDEFGTIFGIIGLVMCSVVIFGMLSRLVQSQRRNIGLFMSMGAKRRTITFHYLKITILLSLIGVMIGLPLGYAFSIGMTRLAGQIYAFKSYLYPIAYEEYIISSLATLAVCTLFSVLSTLSVISITPREAMTAFYNRIKVTKETISVKIFGWIPGFRSIRMRVALREVFFRKKQSLITILAVSTSMIILINSLSMVANMNDSLNSYYDEYNTADIKVKLENPIPISMINEFMENQSEEKISHYESCISIYTKMNFEDEFQTWMELECFQKNSTLRNLNVISGNVDSKRDLNENEIILGQSIAGKYNISINDNITIGTMDNYSVKVAGLVGEMIDFSAFWTIEAFYKGNISIDYFGVPDGYVNGILLKIGEDVDKEDLQEEFRAYFDVSEWLDAEGSKESIMNLMDSMMSILWLFLGVGVMIGIIFSFNTMYMALLSRMNDFVAFKAIGTKPKYLRKMIFRENAILSVFSLLITIPMGYLFYWWSMDFMMGDRFYFPMSIPLYTWPLVFLLSLFSIWLATRRIMKKINKLVLADELRNRIIS